jgi:hypothetical protein
MTDEYRAGSSKYYCKLVWLMACYGHSSPDKIYLVFLEIYIDKFALEDYYIK